MSDMMNESKRLMRQIQICDFAMNDAALFLDMNPDDAMALAYYKKHRDMRKGYADEYTKKYGPITHADYDGGERWKWVDSPWPWQNEEA